MKIASLLMVTVFSLYGCSSQKKLTKEPPFTINNPSYQQYAGGREESGTGFILQFPVDMEAGNDIEFLEVFFRGHVLKAEQEKEGEKFYIICNYKDDVAVTKPDIIMHSDPKKEVGNQPPGPISKENQDFPFELKEDEAVISYKNGAEDPQKRKIAYVKITKIKTKPALNYK